MSQTSHNFKGISIDSIPSFDLVAEQVEPKAEPGLLERIALGGLQIVDSRSDNFNAIVQYGDPETGRVITTVTPTSPRKFFEPFHFETSAELANKAFEQPHSYAIPWNTEGGALEDLIGLNGDDENYEEAA